MKRIEQIVKLFQYIFIEFSVSIFPFSHCKRQRMRNASAPQHSTNALLQINMLHLMRLIHSIREAKNTFRRDGANIGWRWIFDSKLIRNECVGINDTQRTTRASPKLHVISSMAIFLFISVRWPSQRQRLEMIRRLVFFAMFHKKYTKTTSCLSQILNNQWKKQQ